MVALEAVTVLATSKVTIIILPPIYVHTLNQFLTGAGRMFKAPWTALNQDTEKVGVSFTVTECKLIQVEAFQSRPGPVVKTIQCQK